MKKIYPLVLLLFVVAGCSKDFLKRYESRIVGTWRLVDVDRNGIGGSSSNQTFTEGEFVFSENGDLLYTTSAGDVYNGSWDIRRERRSRGCSTDNNGNTDCDNSQVKTLFITAVNFASQHIKTEYFDEMIFTGTNRFKTYIHSGLHTYVFYFRR